MWLLYEVSKAFNGPLTGECQLSVCVWGGGGCLGGGPRELWYVVLRDFWVPGFDSGEGARRWAIFTSKFGI